MLVRANSITKTMSIEISEATSITVDDIFYTLRSNQLVMMAPKSHTASVLANLNSAISLATLSHRQNWTRRFALPLPTDPVLHVNEADFAVPLDYDIVIDKPKFNEVIERGRAKQYIQVKPELLKWTPWASVEVPIAGTSTRLEIQAYKRAKEPEEEIRMCRQVLPGQTPQEIITDPVHSNNVTVVNTSGFQITPQDLRARAPGTMALVNGSHHMTNGRQSFSTMPDLSAPTMERRTVSSKTSSSAGLPTKQPRASFKKPNGYVIPHVPTSDEDEEEVEESDQGYHRTVSRGSANRTVEPFIPSSDEERSHRRSPRKHVDSRAAVADSQDEDADGEIDDDFL